MRILVLSSSFPYPVDSGRKVVMAGFLDFFTQEYGSENVTYATSDVEGDFSQANFRVESLPIGSIRRRAANVLAQSLLLRRQAIQESILYDAAATKKIAELVDSIHPDILFVDTVRMTQYAMPFRQKVAWSMVYFDDLYSLRYLRMLALMRDRPEVELDALGTFARFLPKRLAGVAKIAQKQLLKTESALLRKREIEVASSFDASLLLNGEEAKSLRRLSHAPNIFAVKPLLVPKGERPDRQFTGAPVFLFLGNLSVPANSYALDNLLNIMPQVLEQIPNARLLIIGRGASDNQRAKALHHNSHIEFMDFVPDLAPLMATSAAMVAPIIFGTGVKTKFIDALYYGLPILTTTVGIDGLGIARGQEAIVEDDIGRYPEIMRLMLDRTINEPMSIKGRALYDHEYAPETVRAQYRSIFTR